MTQAMVKWLLDEGHDIIIVRDDWEGCWIIPGAELLAEPRNREMADVNWVIQNYQIDWAISLFDHWTMKQPLDRWGIAWIPIDTEYVSRKTLDATDQAMFRMALSRHGLHELRKTQDTNLFYSPAGVYTDTFTKRVEGQLFRESLGFQDNFVIGTIGQNYGDDRKGYIALLQAFKIFHERYDDVRLYIHTQVSPHGSHTKYNDILIELELEEVAGIPDQYWMRLGLYEEDTLAEIYSGFDVFCLPTRGEGFGIPAIEAQSCEVPVILTDNTTGPELCKQGWLIETDHTDDKAWTALETWRIIPKVSAILEALEKAYADRDKLPEMGKSAREAIVKEYDWKVVFNIHWKPLIQLLERGI